MRDGIEEQDAVVTGRYRSDVATTGTRWPSDRVLRTVATTLTGAAACLALLGIIAALTARATVLDENFLPNTLDRTNTIERIYDEVLVDPDVTRVLDDLSSGFPVQARQTVKAAVGVNLRLVLPPNLLRGMIAELSRDVAEWFRGDVHTMRLQIDLQPVLENIAGAASAYLSEVLAATPTLPTVDLSSFRERVQAFIADVRAGRALTALPRPITGAINDKTLVNNLLSGLPSKARTAVARLVDTALSAGDLGDALAAAGVAALTSRAASAAADLVRTLGSGSANWDITPYVHRVVDPRGGDAIRTARWWLGAPRQVLLWVSGAVLLAALGLFVFAFGGSWAQRLRRVLLALACAAVLTGVLGLLGWVWLGHLAHGVRQHSWPSSVQELLDDNAGVVRRSLLQTWLGDTALIALAAAAAVVLGIGVPAAYRMRGTLRASFRWRPALVAVAAALASAGVIAGVTIAVANMPARGQLRCDGYAYLCDRRYDQVVSLATHNAMANTQDRFAFPLQDPDIDTQLDAGARALQLDSYEWETPDQVAARIRDSGVPSAWASALGRLAGVVNPPRAGTWLCHVVCRAGASAFVPALRELRRWLRLNPDEVVTIILQDETPAALSVAAFRQAGLVPYLARPPANPSAPWPTLREMIASGHRLVAFTENAHGAAPWLQNFWTYGEETPFSFRSVAQLEADSSCVAHRGGTDRPLFLLNHFVTVATGSRQASAEANSAQFLDHRIARCTRLRGRPPTVVAVDFASLGQAQQVVNQLNRRLADPTH